MSTAMTNQLALEITTGEPGYYSWWASSKNKMAGSGAVTWHPSLEAARLHAVACFDRGYRSWPEEQRPRADHVEVSLLRAGDDVGRWGDLTQAQRDGFTRNHPWFTSDPTNQGSKA